MIKRQKHGRKPLKDNPDNLLLGEKGHSVLGLHSRYSAPSAPDWRRWRRWRFLTDSRQVGAGVSQRLYLCVLCGRLTGQKGAEKLTETGAEQCARGRLWNVGPRSF